MLYFVGKTGKSSEGKQTVRENRVTIEDIARHANVSKSTVSRVLNNENAVTETKRRLIQAAIADLNYQPDLFARGLVNGQSMAIGVVTQDISSPFYDTILRGILQGLNGSGYAPIFADGKWQADHENRAIQSLLERRVEGLIILGGQCSAQQLDQLAAQTGLILVGGGLPGLTAQSIQLDDFQGAYLATRYLIEAGHRQIAHITGLLSHQDAVQRRAGYLQAFADSGLAPDPGLIVEGNYLEQAGVMAIEMLLLRGRTFSAVFAANDQMALGARLALYRRGLRVPDDVSLIGFDDQPAAAYLTPPLTTVRQPAVEIGEAAAKAMLQLIKGQPVTIPKITAELVIRESVARSR